MKLIQAIIKPFKLDDVREALRRGDMKTAKRFARVFTLVPVAA